MHWILKYLNIPFKEFGRDEDGCDCWGLVRLIYRMEFGVDVPDYSGQYENCDDSERLSALIPEQAKGWIDIPKGQERPGDVIVLRLMNVPMHTGIVIEKGRFAHVHEGINSVTEDYRRAAWEKRVIGFYRHKELENRVV